MKQGIDLKSHGLKAKLIELEDEVAPIKQYLEHHIPMLENLLLFYQNSNGETKRGILSCILEEKIYFQENRDAAISFTPSISALLNASKALGMYEKGQEVNFDLLSYIAPEDLQLSNQLLKDLIAFADLKFL